MIKPIQTRYKERFFRSRLEARWAVLLDSLNLKWVYEMEGYTLANGMKYLPDFYLPELQCYLEIKPEYPNDRANTKATLLAIESGKYVYTAYGNMAPLEEYIQSYSMIQITHEGHWDIQYWFCQCPICGSLGIRYNGRADRLPCHKSKGCPTSAHGDKGYNYDTPLIVNAFNLATSARFEHDHYTPA